MNLERFKNVILFTLVLLSIYQTGRLWFEYNSNRNFFYTFFMPVNAQTDNKMEQMKSLTIPFRKITNFGNRTFAIDYVSQDINCDRLIADVLQKGVFLDAKPLDWLELLRSKSVIYDYAVTLASADFSNAFVQKSTNIVSRVKNIDSVLMLPRQGSSSELEVYFIDEKAGISYLYSIESSSINQGINTKINEKQSSSEKFFYISAIQNGFDIFKGNQFVPKWADEVYEYKSITYSNPYAQDGEILLYQIEPKIDVFFDNPAYKSEPYPKISGNEENPEYVYVYMCETSVVKYYPNAVLEYSDFRPSNSKRAANFSNSYTQAMAFIQKDQEILNDIYLSKYIYSENQNEYIFYFDYIVNNIPIFLNEAFKKETDMSHGIEIIVKNNIVTNYKRYTCKFEINEDISINATINFSSAIDAIIENNFDDVDNAVNLIQGILLAYKFEKGKFLSWSWNIYSDNTFYSMPAQ